jgi:hypothetical protein
MQVVQQSERDGLGLQVILKAEESSDKINLNLDTQNT